ncbi:MAG TPA: carboxypeptidase-like regulatory domain-containing protein [Nitrososphaerales archaeon]|nr:carboxypeptidase-like regulatory domain-containing protein [Nitrososphaerales archaeon]
MKLKFIIVVLVVSLGLLTGVLIFTTHTAGTVHSSAFVSARYDGPGNAVPVTSSGLTTTINLLPAGDSSPISSVSNGTNLFPVSYYANGTLNVAYAGNTSLTLYADPGTNVTISGITRYLGQIPGEEWVLDSSLAPASFASGTSISLYYYNLLEQPAYYTVIGGGNPPTPSLTYVTAPDNLSMTGQSAQISVALTAVPSSVWTLSGTEASVVNPALANSTTRWATGTSNWNLTAPLQLSEPIAYYHQYYVSFQYSVTGGGSGYSSPTVACPSFGETESVTVGDSAWVDAPRGDAQSSCDFSPTLPGSSDSLRWADQTESLLYKGPGTISQTYWLQYPLSVNYTVVGALPISPPAVTATYFGVHSTTSVPLNSSVVWMDAGSAYTLSNPLPLSNSSERWITTSATSGVLDQAESVSLLYYQQYLINASYDIVGGGTPGAPSLSYTSLGTPESAILTSNAQGLWADGESAYSAPSTLPGSNSTTRWYAPDTSGVANRSIELALTYNRQLVVTITGGGLNSQWFDVNTNANITIAGVFGRADGVGQRVTTYTLDGQAPVLVAPTAQNISVSVLMSSTHQLSISSVTQYQVNLDAATLSAVSYVTPPTIGGDNYWYDSGTNVTVLLNGVWGRGNGTGSRLASYILDGNAPALVATTGTVEALYVSSISSPQELTSVVVTQYYITVSSGSLASISQPPVAGDTGWYDEGSVVNGTFNNCWDVVPNQSRLNAVGYTMNGGEETQLTRSGSGTFVVPIPVSGPLNVSIDYVSQYYLGVSGDPAAQPRPSSPTGDAYFDSGTKLQVTTPETFDVVNGTSRQRVTSFTIGGLVVNVSKAEGTTSTPALVMNSAQQVSFATVTQYLVTLRFTDYSGSVTIAPVSFTVSLPEGAENLTGSKIWFDSGFQFSVTRVSWEGVEASTVGGPGLKVTSPQTLTVQTDVYQASLKVVDMLGFPVSGAQVTVTFGNKSSATFTSGGDGTVSLGLLPAGNYEATAAGLAGTTRVSANPATDEIAVVNVAFSYSIIGIIVAVVLLIVASVVILRIRKSRGSQGRETIGP